MLLTHRGEVAGRDWFRTCRGYGHDMVEAVRKEVMRGATLEDTQRRVTEALAPTYEKPFSTTATTGPGGRGSFATSSAPTRW